MNVPSGIDQAQCPIPMKGAQTFAVPGSPGASRPGAVQLAGVATHQSQVLGADVPEGGGLLAGIPIVEGPDAASSHGARPPRPTLQWRPNDGVAVMVCSGRFMRPPL